MRLDDSRGSFYTLSSRLGEVGERASLSHVRVGHGTRASGWEERKVLWRAGETNGRADSHSVAAFVVYRAGKPKSFGEEK